MKVVYKSTGKEEKREKKRKKEKKRGNKNREQEDKRDKGRREQTHKGTPPIPVLAALNDHRLNSRYRLQTTIISSVTSLAQMTHPGHKKTRSAHT